MERAVRTTGCVSSWWELIGGGHDCVGHRKRERTTWPGEVRSDHALKNAAFTTAWAQALERASLQNSFRQNPFQNEIDFSFGTTTSHRNQFASERTRISSGVRLQSRQSVSHAVNSRRIPQALHRQVRNKEALPFDRQGLQDSHHPHACRFRSRSSDLTTSGAFPAILSGSECGRHEQVTIDVTERNKGKLSNASAHRSG